jgi:hypothetical protein
VSTSTSIERLREALKKGPTPGIWKAQISQQGRACGIVSETGEGIVNWNGLAKPKTEGHANADLIAAANPTTIRALLDELDALRAALAALVENEGLDAFVHLDSGIGTASASGKRWLAARAAINTKEAK